MPDKIFLSVDPGRDKCGLAVIKDSRVVLERKVVTFADFTLEVLGMLSKHGIASIIIGAGTGSREIQKTLLKLDLKCNLIFVPEKDTSQLARQRYWEENKPKGLWKVIPTSLRTPPHPYDDLAAVILAEKFLSDKN
ncbi:MAG: resolvase [Candidatus Margulisbacteria bacterium]|nr:resolvase [Candidatus Margulisiibacteriota bacterium]MBU1021329.1 resolvase [Candidatus Margulisiibacteriota bacterium]MBU1729182.1 resolvase [Candidatus Margulisiibacteriota bacterium]MBU1954855.1 resolvase [Candidatus Margulisiibacteriota bacterium]